jgi:hypothetical protein
VRTDERQSTLPSVWWVSPRKRVARPTLGYGVKSPRTQAAAAPAVLNATKNRSIKWPKRLTVYEPAASLCASLSNESSRLLERYGLLLTLEP